jgi:UDP-N-acetyl-D-glucosamine dehydrogenase
MDLLKKIEGKQARLGVIGLGYVGLPLAVEFARAGFGVVGYDVDERKVAELMAGRCPISAPGRGREERQVPRDHGCQEAR